MIYTLHDNIGFVELCDKMSTDVHWKVANSARISYNRQSNDHDKNKKLVKFLKEEDHNSPFRHSIFTFHIKAPIFVFRQWMKYQVGSTWRTYEVNGSEKPAELFVEAIDHMYDSDKGCTWNEVSARYTELSDEFYIPKQMRGNPSHGNRQASYINDWTEEKHAAYNTQMRECCESIYKNYLRLLDDGVAREIARMILPQNIYSEAYWTVSLQGVLHFLKQRLKDDAQYEIRCMANGIYELTKDYLTDAGIDKNTILS